MMKNKNYSMSITVKLVLFTLMVLNTAIHTFYLGPKMSKIAERSAASENNDVSHEYAILRKRSMMSSGFSLLLSLAITYFGLVASRV